MDIYKGIEKEIIRLKELLVFYKEIPTGFFGAKIIMDNIEKAEKFLDEDDDGTSNFFRGKRILKALKELK